MTKDNGGSSAADRDRAATRAGSEPDQPVDGLPFDEEDHQSQDLISTMFLGRMKDVVKVMRAAATLGLGVRVHNRWVEDGVDTELGEWVVDLFTDGLHVEP